MDYSALITWLSSDNGSAVHAGVFLLLLLGAFGFPIPEDIPVALAGVAAAKGIVDTRTVFFTCYAGVIISDCILFFIGRFFGKRIISAGTRSPFLPAVTEARVEKTREALRKNRLICIFIGRHIFPIRTATFLSAGALHVPIVEFIVADAIAAFTSVTIFMALGYYLGEKLTPEALSYLIAEGTWILVGIVCLAACFYLIKRSCKRGLTCEEKE